MPAYVISDVEGTLTEGMMWKAISAYLRAHGREGDDKAFLRRSLPGVLMYRFRLVNRRKFQHDWIARQARLLAGFTNDELTSLSEWIIENDFWPKRRQAVIDELLEWQKKGARLLLASGLYQPIVQAFARRLDAGNPPAVGTPLEFVNGTFTGRFAGPVSNGEEKKIRVVEIVEDQDVWAAYGDSLSDIPMLELSQLPVAVAPEPELLKFAQEHNWRVLAV